MTNEEKRNGDLLGTKAVGKALEQTIMGIGQFLGKICMPAAEEFGFLLKDTMAHYRLRNLERIIQKAAKRMNANKSEIPGDASPRLMKEILEEASWESDNAVQEMWAGLIAGSAEGGEKNDDNMMYIGTLKLLTAFQARLINGIYGDPRCCSVKPSIRLNADSPFYPKNPVIFDVPKILRFYPGNIDKIIPIHNMPLIELEKEKYVQIQGLALGRFRPQIDGLLRHNLVAKVRYFIDKKDDKDKVHFIPNMPGLDFYMRCLGYNRYPIESFLLTLQHWCELKEIDPFTYSKEA